MKALLRPGAALILVSFGIASCTGGTTDDPDGAAQATHAPQRETPGRIRPLSARAADFYENLLADHRSLGEVLTTARTAIDEAQRRHDSVPGLIREAILPEAVSDVLDFLQQQLDEAAGRYSQADSHAEAVRRALPTGLESPVSYQALHDAVTEASLLLLEMTVIADRVIGGCRPTSGSNGELEPLARSLLEPLLVFCERARHLY